MALRKYLTSWPKAAYRCLDKRGEGGYFWASGLWNPAYDIRSVNNIKFYNGYLDRQKYSSTNQAMLTSY